VASGRIGVRRFFWNIGWLWPKITVGINFEILFLVKVLDMGRIRENRLQGFVQRHGSCSFADFSLEISEKALQDIVGALGLDE